MGEWRTVRDSDDVNYYDEATEVATAAAAAADALNIYFWKDCDLSARTSSVIALCRAGAHINIK